MQKADIFEFIECMAALIRAEERKKCAELRLQLVHFEVLEYLSHSTQYTDTPAATACYFGMTRGTVSQSLIVLEKKGYIEKNKDEDDKRIVHVRLLPQGKAILKKARRTELFNKAMLIFKEKSSESGAIEIFWEVFRVLQKTSVSQAFKVVDNPKIKRMKKASVFEVIESMAILICSEERKKCTQLKLQLVHFYILDYLSLCNKYSDTAKSIANYLGITRGTVSQSLIILEKKAWIKKHQDPHDRRVFHIELLSKGLNILKQVKPTELFKKATQVLKKSALINEEEKIFSDALVALQKANNSYSFGVCKTCKNFTEKPSSFFCELTQEKLNKKEGDKICQEHQAV